uniref:CRAL-TRIO domain-containing protein n=1 Tax=Dunaliella tertiolecta TaxID=3047 RepID=A0A7S3VTL3_DUNTE|mmetsp:Transcript_7806/g.20780  ORF Transcript_7806/g.20780 Transcript_7806/m.20780 type:complete len:453 (-) Transcript_7806:16-1374(-)
MPPADVYSPITPPSSCKKGRHGKQASIDLDADFYDCIDRSDDSFLREFEESLGVIRQSSGADKGEGDEEIKQVESRADGRGQLLGDGTKSGALARVSEGSEALGGSQSGAKSGEMSTLQVTGSISTESESGNERSLKPADEPAEAGGTQQKKTSKELQRATACMDVTTEEIQKVRAQLDPLEPGQEAPDDSMICRFIRATGKNLPQSVQRLNVTLKWRAKVEPESVVCMACAAKAKSHYMHLCGYDSFNRPVIYSCLANATNKVYLDNYHHMIQTFEMAIKCMPPGVEQWVWVCDFHGFGMADINPKLAKAFLEISAEHYPERLGLFIVAGAPALFGVLWKAISSFVDPKTHQKIRFLPCDFTEKKSKMRKEMLQHFSDSLTNWVETEMLQNREKGQAAKKTYDMTSMYKLAQDGKLQPEGKHDLRGHESLLSALAANPALMEPQGTAEQYL